MEKSGLIKTKEYKFREAVARGIEVVGTASNQFEARDKIIDAH